MTGAAGCIDPIRGREQAAWKSSDFRIVDDTIAAVGLALCHAVGLGPGTKVLDVAAAHGDSLLADTRWQCGVTSTDSVAGAFDEERGHAETEWLSIPFPDAEILPFPDTTFDAVLSVFGVMFAANHARAARELIRICRNEGRVGLANWTPTGFIGRVLAVLQAHTPQYTGELPTQWGVEQHLEYLFRGSAFDLHTTHRHVVFRYRSQRHCVDALRSSFNPLRRAFASLSPTAEKRLEKDLLRLIDDVNIGKNSAAVIPSEYVEVVVIKK